MVDFNPAKKKLFKEIQIELNSLVSFSKDIVNTLSHSWIGIHRSILIDSVNIPQMDNHVFGDRD